MASSLRSRYLILLSSIFLVSSLAAGTESVEKIPPFSFSFEKFSKNGSEIAFFGDAEVRNSKVRMFGEGKMVLRKPIRFVGTSPGFSTDFAFSISKGGKGSLDFFMAISNVTGIIAVKFGEYLGIEFGDGISVNKSDLVLSSARKLQSWIDYDGGLKRIEVRVGNCKDLRPNVALLSFGIDLSNVLWKDEMWVGLRTSSWNSTKRSEVYSWSFVVKHGAPYLLHSEPLDPESFSGQSHENRSNYGGNNFTWKMLVALLLGVCFGVLVAVMVFLRSKFVKRHPVAPVEYPVLSMDAKCENGVLDGIKVMESGAK